MRLLWLTPAHTRSAIARFSDLVVERIMARGHVVVVASSEVAFDPADRRGFSNLPVQPAAAHLGDADAFDAVVANFGDHYPNHGGALEALGHPRLVGIFHDADLTNFGNGMAADGWSVAGRPATGRGGGIAALLARGCGGAVAHSRFYRDDLSSCDGPVGVIPLAWAPPENWDAGGAGPKAGETLRVVTFGNINPNKCADRVIRAIGLGKEPGRVEYRLVGAIEPAMEASLRELAAEAGVRLVVRGPVDDDDLMQELRQAEMVSCLRDPVLEGASASAIEAMMQGCAVMVSDAGFYADLPDDCVLKIPGATDVGGIAAGLERLFADRNRLAELGRKARAHAMATFSPDAYAASLLDLIDDVRVASAYLPTIDRIGRQMRGMGLTAGSAAADLVLRAIEDMAPATRRPEPAGPGLATEAAAAAQRP